MTLDEATDLAADWIAAWNDHDLDRVLHHFAPEAEFSSPLVPVVTGRDNPLHGHAEIRAYWEEGLRRLPALHFDLERVYAGVDTVAVAYRNERGRAGLEVLVLGPDGKAIRGSALYVEEP